MWHKCMVGLYKVWSSIYARCLYGLMRRVFKNYKGPRPLYYKKSYLLVVHWISPKRPYFRQSEVIIYEWRKKWRRIDETTKLDRREYGSLKELIRDIPEKGGTPCRYTIYDPNDFHALVGFCLKAKGEKNGRS